MLKNKLYVYGDECPEVPAHCNYGKGIMMRMLKMKDNIAIINAATGDSLTYNEFAQQAADIALSLAHMGVRKGEVVSICSEKRMENMPTIIGSICAGATYSPIDPNCGEGKQSKDTILWSDTRTILVSVPCIIVFLWCWREQYQTNVIFANLRRDKKSGAVVTEEHAVPHGRLFHRVSSPHRMCEVVMYACLVFIKPTTSTFIVFLWVLGNQVSAAISVHKWYKETFKNYPKNRKIIFPCIF